MRRFSRTGMTKGKASEKRVYHPVYKCWQNILSRCGNPKTVEFHRYGGRGIMVCERWKISANFIEDMLPTWFEGATIDRIDNNGNYEPSNCRWVTRAENIGRTSRVHFVMFEGEELSVLQVSKRVVGVSYMTILRRIAKGLSISEAIKPV